VPAEAGIRWSTVQLPVVAGSWRVPGCGRWKSLTRGIFVFGTAVVLAAGSLLARSESREKHRAVTERGRMPARLRLERDAAIMNAAQRRVALRRDGARFVFTRRVCARREKKDERVDRDQGDARGRSSSRINPRWRQPMRPSHVVDARVGLGPSRGERFTKPSNHGAEEHGSRSKSKPCFLAFMRT